MSKIVQCERFMKACYRHQLWVIDIRNVIVPDVSAWAWLCSCLTVLSDLVSPSGQEKASSRFTTG